MPESAAGSPPPGGKDAGVNARLDTVIARLDAAEKRAADSHPISSRVMFWAGIAAFYTGANISLPIIAHAVGLHDWPLPPSYQTQVHRNYVKASDNACRSVTVDYGVPYSPPILPLNLWWPQAVQADSDAATAREKTFLAWETATDGLLPAMSTGDLSTAIRAKNDFHAATDYLYAAITAARTQDGPAYDTAIGSYRQAAGAAEAEAASLGLKVCVRLFPVADPRSGNR